MHELANGLRVQFRVISAMILREIGSRHGGDSVGVYWLLIEPILITMIVIGIHSAGSGSMFVKAVPIVVFLLTGYVPHLMFRHSGLAGFAVLNANGGLLYHRQIHFLDLVFARLFVEIITVLVAFVVICLAFYAYGQINMPYSFSYIYLGWFYHIWFIVDSCLLFTGACFIWPLTRRLFQPLVLLFLPIYAAFFMLSWMSPTVRYYLLFFPPANAAEMMRYGYFGNGALTFFDIPYTTEVCLAMTLLGLLSAFRGRKRLEF